MREATPLARMTLVYRHPRAEPPCRHQVLSTGLIPAPRLRGSSCGLRSMCRVTEALVLESIMVSSVTRASVSLPVKWDHCRADRMELRDEPCSQDPAPGESTVDAFSFCVWAPREVQSPVLHIVPTTPTVNSLGPTPALIPSFLSVICSVKKHLWGFPGGAVVENLPANAGGTGSRPGLGGSHMPRSDWAREPQLLSLRVWSLCSATREAAIVRGPRTAMRSVPRLP